MMMRETIRLLLPQQKYKEALKILRSIVEQSQAYPGCFSSRLYGDLEERNAILIEGMWQDQEHLEPHLRSEEYHNLLMVVEMALKCPEIRFDTIACTTGIETVEKARSRKK
jgi:quinol monooxygenase YgiN